MNKRQGERLGVHFRENGANQRPLRVTCDRAVSSTAMLQVCDLDWNAIVDGADWFHISGVAPAVRATAAELSLAAVRAAESVVSAFRASTTIPRISGILPEALDSRGRQLREWPRWKR